MSAYEPVTTMEQLNALDSDAILAGYRAACGFTQTDYSRKDQAYWHGYLNGIGDKTPSTITADQREPARAYWASQRRST